MERHVMVERLEAACREVGLSQAVIDSILQSTFAGVIPTGPAPGGDVEEMREELEKLRQQRSQIMELLGTKSPEKLVHDLRNVLNELTLLRALSDQDD